MFYFYSNIIISLYLPFPKSNRWQIALFSLTYTFQRISLSLYLTARLEAGVHIFEFPGLSNHSWSEVADIFGNPGVRTTKFGRERVASSW